MIIPKMYIQVDGLLVNIKYNIDSWQIIFYDLVSIITRNIRPSASVRLLIHFFHQVMLRPHTLVYMYIYLYIHMCITHIYVWIYIIYIYIYLYIIKVLARNVVLNDGFLEQISLLTSSLEYVFPMAMATAVTAVVPIGDVPEVERIDLD